MDRENVLTRQFPLLEAVGEGDLTGSTSTNDVAPTESGGVLEVLQSDL